MTRHRSGGRVRAVVAVVAGVALVVVLAVGAAFGGFAVTAAARHSRPAATSPAAVPAAGAALASAAAMPAADASQRRPATAPVPTAVGVARRLAAALRARGLGGRVLASVVDVAGGATLLDRGAGIAAAPASTSKLLTAAALLSVRPPTARISTTVVDAGSGTIVLVGGGDPTLSAAVPGRPPLYAGAARIADLARQVRASGLAVRRVVVDDALFTGTSVSPSWATDDVPSGYGSAITAVMADGGRATPTARVRSAAPDLAAGHALAVALGHPSLPISRGAAPAGATPLALVRSAPLSELVEQMLEQSDNVIAECLGRQVALAMRQPASFLGAAAAIRAVLRAHGVDPGAGMRDASGLAATDRLAPRSLTGVLRLIAGSSVTGSSVTGSSVAGSSATSLRTIIAALPVAAWSGTLADRYVRGASRAAAGSVRAKTGTLTGVSALAGFVHDRGGRLLAFALIADRAGATASADTALDDVAASLASCGCA